uniref:Uncharacterized protein n=1 Tax=Zea mays TaxID=4577 RepID=B7ZWS5_MAIZE|nr:unknown [Zea mays]
MREAGVDEHPCLRFAFRLSQRCQHSTSQSLEGCDLCCAASTRIRLAAAPIASRIRRRRRQNVVELSEIFQTRIITCHLVQVPKTILIDHKSHFTRYTS